MPSSAQPCLDQKMTRASCPARKRKQGTLFEGIQQNGRNPVPLNWKETWPPFKCGACVTAALLVELLRHLQEARGLIQRSDFTWADHWGKPLRSYFNHSWLKVIWGPGILINPQMPLKHHPTKRRNLLEFGDPNYRQKGNN